jgi:hypothetical protein
MVSLDRGFRLAGLWCFQVAGDTNQYVYLPGAARLARDADGRPQFSFVRYVSDAPAGAEGAGIGTARGGGVLHFLVEYVTPAESVAAARQALREVAGDSARLRGPIVFTGGRYTLISSVVRTDSGPNHVVLATGSAPVLEGNRIALSFDLAPEAAALLLATFRTAAPDISILFDMTLSGLSAAYDAELEVDWADVRRTMDLQAGGTVYYVGADVKLLFDSLMRSNSIRLRSSGGDAAMEGLLQVVYDKLLTLMFRPAQPEEAPAAERGNMLDALAMLSNPQRMSDMSRQITGFGLYAGFKLQELKTSGRSVLRFNHRAPSERHATIVFNIGDLYRRFGGDTAHFRAVNLLDPLYQRRELLIAVDGALAAELERGGAINSVTVTVRKRHENGRQTLKEVVLDPRRLNVDSAPLRVTYGWDGDDDRLAWLQYDVRTQWSFAGGGVYRTPWAAMEASMIDLYAPFERRVVQVVGDSAALARQRVRAVVVDVQYPFFDRQRRHQMVVRVAAPAGEHQVEILLPRDQFGYDYSVRWQLEGGRSRSAGGHDSSGLIFIDEVPEENP